MEPLRVYYAKYKKKVFGFDDLEIANKYFYKLTHW